MASRHPLRPSPCQTSARGASKRADTTRGDGARPAPQAPVGADHGFAPSAPIPIQGQRKRALKKGLAPGRPPQQRPRGDFLPREPWSRLQQTPAPLPQPSSLQPQAPAAHRGARTATATRAPSAPPQARPQLRPQPTSAGRGQRSVDPDRDSVEGLGYPMDNEIAEQLSGVMFRKFGPEVDPLVFGSLPAQLPAPLLLLLLLLRRGRLGRDGGSAWDQVEILQSSRRLHGLKAQDLFSEAAWPSMQPARCCSTASRRRVCYLEDCSRDAATQCF